MEQGKRGLACRFARSDSASLRSWPASRRRKASRGRFCAGFAAATDLPEESAKAFLVQLYREL